MKKEESMSRKKCRSRNKTGGRGDRRKTQKHRRGSKPVVFLLWEVGWWGNYDAMPGRNSV